MIFNGLVKYASRSGEAGTQIVPDLAEAMPTISADAKTYTFKLRQGVKFAAPVSREVTADDFKWSFERMMRLPKAPATFFYEGIVGATGLRQRQGERRQRLQGRSTSTRIEIQLKQPDATFLNKLAMPFMYVLPKEWVAKWGTHFNRHPAGHRAVHHDELDDQQDGPRQEPGLLRAEQGLRRPVGLGLHADARRGRCS